MFEVGKEYWVVYGSTEEQSHSCVKVLEVQGQWLRVESKELDSHLNMAAPMFISARERDRGAEKAARIANVVFVDPNGNETGRMGMPKPSDEA